MNSTRSKATRRSKRLILIFSVVFWTNTAAADDTICVPRSELEAAAAQLDAARKSTRECIAEAHRIRSDRDQCLGRGGQLDVMLRANKIEISELRARNSTLIDTIDDRISWWVWYSLGLATPILGVVAWQVAK